MTTGTVTELPGQVDRVISATVRGLAAGRGMVPAEVAAAIGVSAGTMNYRLRCVRPWTAAEVRRVADLFQVRISDLYSGFDGTFPGSEPRVTRGRKPTPS